MLNFELLNFEKRKFRAKKKLKLAQKNGIVP